MTEYKIVTNNNEKKLEEEINSLAKNGWELVNVSIGGTQLLFMIIACLKKNN